MRMRYLALIGCAVGAKKGDKMSLPYSFEELKEGDQFEFENELYIKTSKDRALTLAGSRFFKATVIVHK